MPKTTKTAAEHLIENLARKAADARKALGSKLDYLRRELHDDTVRLEQGGPLPSLGYASTLVDAQALVAKISTLEDALSVARSYAHFEAAEAEAADLTAGRS